MGIPTPACLHPGRGTPNLSPVQPGVQGPLPNPTAGASHTWLLAALAALFLSTTTHAQVDPTERRLLHLGYNQPIEGKTPIALYAFYLHNQTNFLREDWTLRAAVAPVWVDAQLGWKNALGPNTDLGLLAAGGGFARTHNELRLGEWEQGETFTGHGYTTGAAAYHVFNPNDRVPLFGIVAGTLEGSFYVRDDETDARFELPKDHTDPVLRAGLRWGGQEPDFRSPFALEVSAWYENRWRLQSGPYGFDGDRELEDSVQLYWGRVLGRYTTSDQRHDLEFALTSGGSIDVDRLSAYRLGGMLPFASEFPLMIPGYYHDELSARNFLLLSGNYSIGISHDNSWRFALFGAAASLDYLEGLEYPSRSHSGVGGGIGWRSPRRDWVITGFYGYGFDALRDESLGGHMVGIVLQYDFLLEGGWEGYLSSPRISQGLLRLFSR